MPRYLDELTSTFELGAYMGAGAELGGRQASVAVLFADSGLLAHNLGGGIRFLRY